MKMCGENCETFVADVRKFTEAAGCSTNHFNARQTALYIGLQLEELAEKFDAIYGYGNFVMSNELREWSTAFKSGQCDGPVAMAGMSVENRTAMLDADIDLAWVTVGAALSAGADVLGAMREVARSNLSKIAADGSVIKDENGKVKKPEGFSPPNLTPFICEV